MDKPSIDNINVKAVILAGGLDFGRCPLASCLSPALWPLAGQLVLERLLAGLAQQGITQAVVCSHSQDDISDSHLSKPKNLNVTFLDEPLPGGTAGSILAAANGDHEQLYLVMHATTVTVPDINELLRTHRRDQADLTVAINPAINPNESEAQLAGIYICEPAVMKYIPEKGYCDIKEKLIPNLLRANKTVKAVRLAHPVGNFRNRLGYLQAAVDFLMINREHGSDLPGCDCSGRDGVWISPKAEIDPGARVYGPVAVMDGAKVQADAIIIGPTIIEKNVSVGHGSLIVDSVLWPGAVVGADCEVHRSLLTENACVGEGEILEEKLIFPNQRAIPSRLHGSVFKRFSNGISQLQSTGRMVTAKIDTKLPHWARADHFRKHFRLALASLLFLLVFLWSYGPTLADLWNIWIKSDEYSCGLLVPAIVLYIVWSRRNQLARCHIKPWMMGGLFAFLIAQALRYFGLFFMYSSAERLSVVVTIAAILLLIFGWSLFKKLATLLLFLCLMLPLPKSVESRLTLPLQSWATTSAVFCLETIGYDVTRDGNIIHLGDTTVAVAEACNGLRMLTAFVVIAGLVVLLIKQSWWEKSILLLSSAPIGLLCNTIRLTLTAIAFTVLKGEFWEKVFHDFGGYAMMPLALALVVLELWILTKLIILPPDPDDNSGAGILIVRPNV